MAPHRPTSGLSRRNFVTAGVAAGTALALSPFEALAAATGSRGYRHAYGRPAGPGYGPIAPVDDTATGLPLLELPAGFEYTSFGWTGDPLDDGSNTPSNQDGMGCFRLRGRRLALIRNHERSLGAPFSPAAPVYDPAAGGGTTTLVFDPRTRQPLAQRASLTGTLRNCAGGTTPWRSWISAEETTDGPGNGPLQREHGYCFEVPLRGTASAQPLRAMGRFVHEAVAFEPTGEAAYLTEDANNAGLYRFRPHRRGRLDSGRLEMLRIRDDATADLTRIAPGDPMAIDWVGIDEPAPAGSRADVARNSVFAQGRSQGGARFRRLEGIFYGNGLIYFVSTSGGPTGRGQVFELDTRRDTLRVLFASTAASELESPDNVAVSPRGGIVLCEDGPGRDRMLALTARGEISEFARGNVFLTGHRGFIGDFRSSELAGACWDPLGAWLFVNVQRPGITLAIRGPWRRGGL